MNIVDIIGLGLFLYSFTTTIALIVADNKVQENFTWGTAALCFVWPITLILILLNKAWENSQ